MATVVTMSMTIAGTVEAFGDSARADLTATLQDALRCHEPSCFIELRVSSASVQLAVVLTVPDAVAGSATTATDIAAAASTLASTDSASLSSTLGVSVTSITPPTVQQAVSVPLVVAPPPPMPPTPLPSPLPPPSHPSPPAQLVMSGEPVPPPMAPRPSDGGGDTSTVIIGIAAAVVGSALLLLAIVRSKWGEPSGEPQVKVHTSVEV